MQYTQQRQARPGFTFIELVIAIAILGILAAIVGPPMMRYVGRAKERAAAATLKTLKTSIETFHADTGRFPATLSDLTFQPSDPKAARKWQGPYVENVGEDPWNNEYVYRPNRPGAVPPYELFSYGALGEGAPQESWISVWNL